MTLFTVFDTSELFQFIRNYLSSFIMFDGCGLCSVWV
jgi:hypothetical protein